MEEELTIGRLILIIGIACIVVAVIGGLVWRVVFFQPYQNTAFNDQVQGLVTEYCTAPRTADQEAARSQLRTLVAGKPDDFSNLPSALKQEAQAVVNDDARGACS